MAKNSNKDILIYTGVIILIMLLRKSGLYGYTVMNVLLVLAIAAFAGYSFRNGLKKLLFKK